MPFRRIVGPLELTITNLQTDSDHRNIFALSGMSMQNGGGAKNFLGFLGEPILTGAVL